MVSAYRLGFSLREIAEEFNVTKSTVQRWVRYAAGKRLDRVDFSDKKEVKIEKEDGKQFTIEIAYLRKEDQDYVKRQLDSKTKTPEDEKAKD
jgi:transposase